MVEKVVLTVNDASFVFLVSKREVRSSVGKNGVKRGLGGAREVCLAVC